MSAKYSILFTKHLTQKRKVFCDGTMSQNGKKIIIYDDTDSPVDTTYQPPSNIGVGKEFRTDKFLVQISDLLSSEDVAPSNNTNDNTKTVVNTPKTEIKPSNPLRRAKLGRGSKSLGARHKISKPIKKSSSEQQEIRNNEAKIREELAGIELALQEEAELESSQNETQEESQSSQISSATTDSSSFIITPRNSFEPISSFTKVARLTPPPPEGRSLSEIIEHLEE